MAVIATIGRKELTPGAHFIAEGSVIVWVNENGDIRATIPAETLVQ